MFCGKNKIQLVDLVGEGVLYVNGIKIDVVVEKIMLPSSSDAQKQLRIEVVTSGKPEKVRKDES